MAGGFLSRLIASMAPRSDNYFALYNELAGCTVRGAKLLAKMSSTHDPAAFSELFGEIKKTEGEADGVTRNIFLSLPKTFLTPFDHWEMKDLAMALDDMIDYMEDIPQRAGFYGPGDSRRKWRRSARSRCAPRRRSRRRSRCSRT